MSSNPTPWRRFVLNTAIDSMLGGEQMFLCVICRFDVPLDDTVITGRTGRCICLRCYKREVEDEQPMPKPLRKEVAEIVNAMTY